MAEIINSGILILSILLMRKLTGNRISHRGTGGNPLLFCGRESLFTDRTGSGGKSCFPVSG